MQTSDVAADLQTAPQLHEQPRAKSSMNQRFLFLFTLSLVFLPKVAGTSQPDLIGVAGAGQPEQISAAQWLPPPHSGVLYRGYPCTVDVMKTWSLKSSDANELRFEVQPGDRLYNPETGYVDPPTAERSEMSFPAIRWANGVDVTIEYEFLVPSGFDFDTAWAVVGQMHANTQSSPPFEIAFRNGSGLNRLLMIVRGGRSSSLLEREFTITTDPIQRDTWHQIKLEAKMSEVGRLRAWLDQERVLDLEGEIGLTDQTNWYWRMGVYRKAARERYVVFYRNFSMHQS